MKHGNVASLGSDQSGKSKSNASCNGKAGNRRSKKKVNLLAYCREIAENDSILDKLTTELHEEGVAGQEKQMQILYMCATSRLTMEPVSVVVQGNSSVGKSFLVDRTLERTPKKGYLLLSSVSKKGLILNDESYVHRMIVIHEMAGIKDVTVEYQLRTLLADHCIKYQLPNQKAIEKHGPAGLISTTTDVDINHENETRYLLVDVDESEEQTKQIALMHADKFEKGTYDEQNIQRKKRIQRWIAYQIWLQRNMKPVVVPYATDIIELCKHFPTRFSRDSEKILTLISTHALMHQKTRKLNDKGQIVAMFKDYKVIYNLLNEVISIGANIKVSANIVNLVKAVEELIQNGSPNGSVTMTKCAERLGVNKSSISRSAKIAIEKEYLINAETRKGFPAILILGDPLPTKTEILPSPKEVKEHYDRHIKEK